MGRGCLTNVMGMCISCRRRLSWLVLDILSGCALLTECIFENAIEDYTAAFELHQDIPACHQRRGAFHVLQ